VGGGGGGEEIDALQYIAEGQERVCTERSCAGDCVLLLQCLLRLPHGGIILGPGTCSVVVPVHDH
jgi:hypothetical protein